MIRNTIALEAWQAFVLRHPAERTADLSYVLNQSEKAIRALRRQSGPLHLGTRQIGFAALFRLWHNRDPHDHEWPPIRRTRAGGTVRYEWQAPELALLADLAHRMSVADIAHALTLRLQRLTGDPNANRTARMVSTQLNALVADAASVLNGLTISQAGQEIGSRVMIANAIESGELPAYKIGRHHLIPYEAWCEWEAKFGIAQWLPAGWLTPVRAALDANVSMQTLVGWLRNSDLSQMRFRRVWLISAVSLRDRARIHWSRVQSNELRPPDWFLEELEATTL